MRDRAIPVTVSLSMVVDAEGSQSWFGGFLWGPDDDVEIEGDCRVELEDGRSGKVLLLYEVVVEGRPGAAFRGVGTLE